MKRPLVWVLAIFVLGGGLAYAQKIQCIPRSSCKRPVTFTPTAQDIITNLNAYLLPDASSPELSFRLIRDRDEAFNLEVSRSSWSPNNQLDLQARYTFSDKKKDSFTTAWLSLSELPERLLNGDQKRTDISVEYRIRLTGEELAGTYETQLSYFAWDNRDKKNRRDTISHSIRIVLPGFVSLRVAGVPVGQTASVSFDYTTGNVLDYLRAVSSSEALSVTSSELTQVEIYTNHPKGYTVTLDTTLTRGSDDGFKIENLWLNGVTADGQILRRSEATQGFIPLVLPEDLSIFVDGSEDPGDYGIELVYRARLNP